MKFLNFILSFILPNKMENRRDMNVFIAILIYLACAIMMAGIPNIRINKVVKDKFLTECYCFEETFDTTLDELSKVAYAKIPAFEMKSDNSIKYAFDNEEKVIELKYNTKSSGKKINLTIVYLPYLTNDDEIPMDVFDLNAYLKVNPFDENHQLKSQDVLAIYTNKVFYFIFNHGYTLAYINASSDASLEDYHYLYIPNWESKGDWSLYRTALDEEGKIKRDANNKVIYAYYKYDEENNIKRLENEEIDYDYSSDESRYSERIYNANINKMFAYSSQQNIGMYSYLELNEQGINVLDVRNLNALEEFSETMIASCVTSVKTTSYILSLFFNVLLPLLWVFVMWLLLHRNGELTRFKEYYAIGASSMILPSIITSIVGLFYPYTLFARIAMIVTALYYLVCVLFINNMGRKARMMMQTKPKSEKSEDKEVETVPIKEFVSDVKEDDTQRPGRIG